MRAGMAACCLGIGGVAWASRLPPPWLLALAAVALAAASWRWRGARARRVAVALWGLLGGIAWGTVYGVGVVRGLLPAELEQQPLWLRGRVVDLIETQQSYGRDAQRFLLRVQACERSDGAPCGVDLHTAQLTAYRPLPLASGETWRLRVRLKRPHGFANPGGFDFESWQVQRRIGAVGSVVGASAERVAPAPWHSSDHHRARLRDHLARRLADFAHRDLLLALLVADGSAIDRAQWRLFRDTGTVHLFVVSGSHIAFTGGLVWWLARLWRRLPYASGSRREQWLCALPALLVAAAYALLAGMGLPIQRALIMFAVFALNAARRRDLRFFDVLLLALTLVLLRDPLAARDAGCWFSFAAVAALALAFAPRAQPGRDRWRWWRAQWLVFVAGLPILLLIGGQFTLLALPANAVAVPLTTLLTLPAAFAALALDPLLPALARPCWHAADASLQGLLWLLDALRAHGGWLVLPLAAAPAGIGFAAVAVLLALLPRGVRVRALAPVMLLPLLLPARAALDERALRLTVFDVGQGLSALIETRSHRLLYDTGPGFAAGSSAAELALLPALRQRGIRALDQLMISHRDNDHAGGAAALLAELAVAEVVVGERLRLGRQRHCAAGQRWEWDGVTFTVLGPPLPSRLAGNNRSCVLRVDGGGGSVLLAGDIEAAAEAHLLRGQLAPVTVLIAPHHGSRTSSSPAFVAAVRPRYVVFSAGYRNRFGHPHPQVLARYRQAGATPFATADSGAIAITLRGDGVQTITEYRKEHRHYWDGPGFSAPP